MENEFCNYTQALALKELGFDEASFGHYRTFGKNLFYATPIARNLPARYRVINAPLYQQAFRWFREKHGLCNFINFSGNGFCSGWEDLGNNEHGFENFKTYEEAESACLDKLIEICRNK